MSRTVAKISRREKWKRYIEKNRKGNWYFLKKDAKEIVFRKRSLLTPESCSYAV